MAIFIQAGGSEDSVLLVRKDSTGEAVLFHIPYLFTGNSTNALRMKIVCDSSGNLRIFGDPAGGISPMELGGFNLNDKLPGNFFSLFCRFTSSNATKFYFDDIYYGPEIVDTTGPVILKARIIKPSEILLVFNEPLDEASASDISNYLVPGNPEHPYEAVPFFLF